MASSSSTSRSWKYDVFISFRGEDTRKTFVDHLYSALHQHHILTYKDDVTLDRGDTIGPALKSAIRESHIALIIFSENYADSSWCLDELSYIMKCKEEDSGQIVLPIFYHVDPSDVRKQMRKFGEAFAKHELSENNKKKVESWKKVLVDASNIAGWETKHVANGHEARCIKEIVGSILDKLSSQHCINRGEHPNNPEKHSRVWQEEDIEDMCSRNASMENDKIEAIQCDASGCSFNFIMLVLNMKKLRFLNVTTTSFDEGPSFLLNELRYLSWSYYPASLLPESFQPRKLVLKIGRSLQKELWKGYKYLPCLKELKLSWMEALVRTPDFGGLPCLQKLTLERCGSLEEIHQSLGNHSSLVHVYVCAGKKLTRFPSIVRMDKLKTLDISECKSLVEFPKIEAKMDSLVELSLRHVGIEILPSTIVEYCTNLASLSLWSCSELKSIDGNFHALKGLQTFKLEFCYQLEKLPKGVFNKNLDGLGLRKLNLICCHLGDGEIPKEVGQLSSLRELDLSYNKFIRLDFSLSRLTSLKLLDLRRCENLVELPELPSSLAILKADWCKSLEVIKDDAHRRCKWLCLVLILGEMKNIINGGGRLLETMLQGMAVESGCMILQLTGLEIPRVFEPRLFRGGRCRMQLPENWYTHFSGFLFCTASEGYTLGPSIRMKHMEKSVDDDDVFWEVEEKTFDETWLEYVPFMKTVAETWVGYVPFSLLRNTSWWDPTSTAVTVDFYNSDDSFSKIIKCGWKLVPKGGAASDAECSSSSETTPTTHSSSSSDNYKCKLRILHDSKSALKFKIHHIW